MVFTQLVCLKNIHGVERAADIVQAGYSIIDRINKYLACNLKMKFNDESLETCCNDFKMRFMGFSILVLCPCGADYRLKTFLPFCSNEILHK